MGKYIIRRLLQMIPVIIGVTFIIYVAVFALGDPTVGRCGERPCPPGYIAAFRAEYNLDKPLIVQYLLYMGNLVQGDLGTNFFGNRWSTSWPPAGPTTLKLGLMAMIIETVIGITAGVLAGIRRGQVHRQPGHRQHPGADLDPDLRDRRLGPADLRRPARLVPGDRDPGHLLPADHAGLRARLGLGGLRRPTDAGQPGREPARRLRAHGQGQGSDQPRGPSACTRCATRSSR